MDAYVPVDKRYGSGRRNRVVLAPKGWRSGGEKPADLPIGQASKFVLVLNPRTAKSLGIAAPDRLLAVADEVIE